VREKIDTQAKQIRKLQAEVRRLKKPSTRNEGKNQNGQ
jgi:hypothetical protein